MGALVVASFEASLVLPLGPGFGFLAPPPAEVGFAVDPLAGLFAEPVPLGVVAATGVVGGAAVVPLDVPWSSPMI